LVPVHPSRDGQNAPADGQVTVFVRLASTGGLVLVDLRPQDQRPGDSNIPDASVALDTSSHPVVSLLTTKMIDDARATSWVSCDVARPSECVASRAHNPSGRYALGFVLHASFNYGVFMTEPAGRSVRVGQARLELATPRLSSACSNQLSYWPADRSVAQDRIAD
jgi:hypothetical protein